MLTTLVVSRCVAAMRFPGQCCMHKMQYSFKITVSSCEMCCTVFGHMLDSNSVCALITEGSTAKLDCVVGGNPLPTLTWLTNNVEVEETATRKCVVEGDNCALVFREVKKTEGGQYTAKATNVNGAIVSTTELVVLEGRLVIVYNLGILSYSKLVKNNLKIFLPQFC